MTDLLSRPVLRVQPAPDGHPGSPALAGAMAALWVAAVGLVSCLVLAVGAWFAADTGSFAGAARVGGLAWLAGSGAGLSVAGASVGLVPLGFVLMSGLMLHRGGRWAAERAAVNDVRRAALAVVSLAGTYAAVMEITALVTRDDRAQAGLVRAAVAGALVGAVAGGSGVLRQSRLAGPAFVRLPDDVRAAVTGGVAGALALVFAGTVALVASLAVHFPEAVELAEALEAGYVGGLVLAVVALALVPNAALWAGSYLAGPGFAVGDGTLVAPGSVELGPLPTFPLLAALPRGDGGWWVALLVAAPVLAMLVAGVLAQLSVPAYSLDRAALRGGLAGVTAGLLFGGLAWLSGGSAGPGRLAAVGPEVLPLVLVCTATGLVGGALGGAGTRWLQGRAVAADDT